MAPDGEQMSTVSRQAKNQADGKQAICRRALISFCGYGLILSSAVKFVHQARAVAYMASMGFEGTTVFDQRPTGAS